MWGQGSGGGGDSHGEKEGREIAEQQHKKGMLDSTLALGCGLQSK